MTINREFRLSGNIILCNVGNYNLAINEQGSVIEIAIRIGAKLHLFDTFKRSDGYGMRTFIGKAWIVTDAEWDIIYPMIMEAVKAD